MNLTSLSLVIICAPLWFISTTYISDNVTPVPFTFSGYYSMRDFLNKSLRLFTDKYMFISLSFTHTENKK